MGMLLYILSWFLDLLLTIIFGASIIGYYIFSFKWISGLKEFDQYSKHLALSRDQHGNVQV